MSFDIDLVEVWDRDRPSRRTTPLTNPKAEIERLRQAFGRLTGAELAALLMWFELIRDYPPRPKTDADGTITVSRSGWTSRTVDLAHDVAEVCAWFDRTLDEDTSASAINRVRAWLRSTAMRRAPPDQVDVLACPSCSSPVGRITRTGVYVSSEDSPTPTDLRLKPILGGLPRTRYADHGCQWSMGSAR